VATDGAASVAAGRGGKRDSDGRAAAQPSAGNDGSGALSGLIPSVSDPPKGEVTLGTNAGAFGPWRAHQVIDAIAKETATAVTGKIAKEIATAVTGKAEPMLSARVLVVGDRSVLSGDWTARQVGYTLARLEHRLDTLREQLTAGRETLKQAIRDLADPGSATNAGKRGPGDVGLRVNDREVSEPAVKAAPDPAGALDDAVDLLDLIRTDYTLTANTVTPGPAELVTLTAAHLAKLGLWVETDVLAIVGDSPCMKAFSELLGNRDTSVELLFELERDLVPLGDSSSGPASAGPASTGAASRATGQARALADYARQVISDVDTATSALTTAPPGGQAPLYTAACRERLAFHGAAARDGAAAKDGMKDGITHVLYVSLDSIAADTVTRRSILGASGIVRFLAAGNGSWLLLDTDKGMITAGSQQSHADALSFSLVTGQATYDDGPSVPKARTPLTDPMAFTERAAKALVVALAILLAIIGILSLIAVARIAIY
jgi:hypothetical protein